MGNNGHVNFVFKLLLLNHDYYSTKIVKSIKKGLLMKMIFLRKGVVGSEEPHFLKFLRFFKKNALMSLTRSTFRTQRVWQYHPTLCPIVVRRS